MCAKHTTKYSNQPILPFDEWGGNSENDLILTREDRWCDDRADRNLHYICMGSGSSGNCCYIGNSQGGFLIDAGVKRENVEKILASYGIKMTMVKGLLLTHDHADHVHYAYNFLRNNKHMRLFCSNRVMTGLLRRHSISKRIKEYHFPIFKEIPFKIFDFEITAFDVPHDGSDNMGFSIDFDGRRFVLATDLGKVTERAHHYMSQANYLVIEANYDYKMLMEGKYPEYLKARIQTERGHLDNRDTAAFIKEILTDRLKYIFLCHLSKDNNTPALALKEVRDVLELSGKRVGKGEDSISDRSSDIQLMALPRFEPTRKFVFPPLE